MYTAPIYSSQELLGWTAWHLMCKLSLWLAWILVFFVLYKPSRAEAGPECWVCSLDWRCLWKNSPEVCVQGLLVWMPVACNGSVCVEEQSSSLTRSYIYIDIWVALQSCVPEMTCATENQNGWHCLPTSLNSLWAKPTGLQNGLNDIQRDMDDNSNDCKKAAYRSMKVSLFHKVRSSTFSQVHLRNMWLWMGCTN